MTIRDPAVLFLLWNAFHPEPSALTFDVTRANLPRIGRPDPRWLDAACRALGVSGRPGDCRVSALRSSYFSDEPEARAPEDRWPDCWTIEATLDGELPAGAGCGAPGAPLAELDPSWDGKRDPAHDGRALIVAVGEAGSAQDVLEEAGEAAAAAGLQATSAGVMPCAGGRSGIRLVVPCELARDVSALERVTERLTGLGWATNWRGAL